MSALVRREEGRGVSAGGVGITPFMAAVGFGALRDGLEDFDLTIIYGSRTEAGIVYKKELEEVAAACDKVHVVHVLSGRGKEGYEQSASPTADHQEIRRRGVQHLPYAARRGCTITFDTQIEPPWPAP